MPQMRTRAAQADMLRRRRSLREALAGLAITVLGALMVFLVVDSSTMRIGAVVLPLAVAGYVALAFAGYRRSRTAYQALARRQRDVPPN